MINIHHYKEALLIRRVEETLLELFGQGKLNGTVHTCIGQEFSAVAFASQLDKEDFIFSNHRCHGHYISFTKDYQGLLLELTGKEKGICAGIGGSQHLCKDNFFSNGIQGSIVPVSAGMALSKKLNGTKNIGILFIGDGTLGEGVVYETLNIISKWELPLLVVCENNFYAQSTKIQITLAGNIAARAEAFGIKTFFGKTQNPAELLIDAKESINYVRNQGKPAFYLVETYRLNAHSKGDDDRDNAEVDLYKEKDPLNIFAKSNPEKYNEILKETNNQINEVLQEIESSGFLPIEKYLKNSEKDDGESLEWIEVEVINERIVNLLNQSFHEEMSKNEKIIFIGEDVLSPYGGAFKVAKDLSAKFPNRVFSTPISEAAIVGISNGLALGGYKPFAEIMFGDFITLAMDQIINNASKFYHMYNKKVTCPLVIRTPMGGGRGYGPTHSQTLDKFLLGIDNVKVIALNALISPKIILKNVINEKHPLILLENKVDYGKTIAKKSIKNYEALRTNCTYPLIKYKPLNSSPDYTIIGYGGTSLLIQEAIERLFYEHELLGEAFFLSQIHPFKLNQLNEIASSVLRTKSLFVVEEGSSFAGFGSEIVASLMEKVHEKIIIGRICSEAIPIPSAIDIEKQVLINTDAIINKIKNNFHDRVAEYSCS